MAESYTRAGEATPGDLRSRANDESWLASRVSSGPVRRALRLLLVALSALFLLLFLYTAVRRMRYPFELEWIESGIAVSVMRIAHGQGLYVAPTLDFVPFLYAPLYFYVAAPLTRFFGPGYAAMRFVSTLSALGTSGVIYTLVSLEGRPSINARTRQMAGVCGAGLFLACYPLVEAFYDIGRVDSLFVFLFVLAIFFTRRGWPVPAAIAWVLCCQTKQSILPLAFVMLCLDWKAPRRVVAGLVTLVVLMGASMAALNHWTHGWYLFYLFRLTGGFGIVWRQAALYVPQGILTPMGLTLALALAAVVFTGVELKSRTTMFYGGVTLFIYAAIGYVAAHAGAATNALIPVYAWTSVLFGVALSRLLAWLQRSASPWAATAETVVLAAAAIQLAMFIYNPGRYIPPPKVLAERERFLDQLRALPGDVYILNHSYDAILAGKKPHAEGEALGAVLDAKTGEVRERLRAELDREIAERKFSAVVTDKPAEQTLLHSERSYPMGVLASGGAERYLTSQPHWINLPCGSRLAGSHDLLAPDSTIRYGTCEIGGESPAGAPR